MKKFYQIAIVSFTLLFFMSTTGVTVYEHYCAHDGEISSFFLEVNHDCSSDIHSPQESHACCLIDTESESSDGGQVSELCCTDDVLVYQIGVDLLVNDEKKSQLQTVDFPYTLTPFVEYVSIPYEVQNPNGPPLVPLVATKLAQLQRYLL